MLGKLRNGTQNYEFAPLSEYIKVFLQVISGDAALVSTLFMLQLLKRENE